MSGPIICSTCSKVVVNASHRCVCDRCGVAYAPGSGVHQERECIASLRGALAKETERAEKNAKLFSDALLEHQRQIEATVQLWEVGLRKTVGERNSARAWAGHWKKLAKLFFADEIHKMVDTPTGDRFRVCVSRSVHREVELRAMADACRLALTLLHPVEGQDGTSAEIRAEAVKLLEEHLATYDTRHSTNTEG